MDSLSITRPDDWHVHLRDGTELNAVALDTAKQFARAVIMPNLTPPVTRVSEALNYRQRILAALPPSLSFSPLMALYLTDRTTSDIAKEAAECPDVIGFKLYPQGATTNSEAGISSLEDLYPTLAILEKLDIPLLIHGEVTDASVDVFDREAVFIDRYLNPISQQFPALRIVLEHITTREAVQFVQSARAGIGATITAHHLLLNRNAMFDRGIRPHHYCLPVLKREPHRQALLQAATSGHPRFFLGTDSAPHGRRRKESDCGCAGCYTASHALALYATAFESVGALDALEAFSSHFGADFYRLPRNQEQMVLRRQSDIVPESIPYGDDQLIPFLAGQALPWRAGLA